MLCTKVIWKRITGGDWNSGMVKITRIMKKTRFLLQWTIRSQVLQIAMQDLWMLFRD